LVTDSLKSPNHTVIYGDTSRDPRRNSRHSKMLPHLYFPDHEWSLYIDGSMEIIKNVNVIAEKYLKNNLFAQFQHKPREIGDPLRKTDLYDEGLRCIEIQKDDPLPIAKQLLKYAFEGHPRNFGLWSGGSILRRHNDPMMIKLGEMWWQELNEHSWRDQISYPYCLWKLGIKPAPIDTKEDLFISKRKHLFK
jgi:hypothetical protein